MIWRGKPVEEWTSAVFRITALRLAPRIVPSYLRMKKGIYESWRTCVHLAYMPKQLTLSRSNYITNYTVYWNVLLTTLPYNILYSIFQYLMLWFECLSSCWNSLAIVIVLRGRTFKGWLGHGGLPLMNRLMPLSWKWFIMAGVGSL